MGTPILLLRLEGPLQSWGGRSRWDVRDTQPEPSKSGVVGLLACALGYGRGDRRIEALDRALRFGVRVEAAGRVLEDYQTITGYLPTANGGFKHSGVAVGTSLSKLEGSDATPATIISPRFYLEDAAFLVALAARTPEDAALLKHVAAAVQAPHWPLFLGRKACLPTRPIFAGFTDQYADTEAALREHPWSWHGAGASVRQVNRPTTLSAFIEDERGSQRRQDAVRLNPTRTYGFIRLRSLRLPLSPPQEALPCTSPA